MKTFVISNTYLDLPLINKTHVYNFHAHDIWSINNTKLKTKRKRNKTNNKMSNKDNN